MSGNRAAGRRGKRTDGKIVAVRFQTQQSRLLQSVREQAHTYGWRLLDLDICLGAMPEYPRLDGAIIANLPSTPLFQSLVDANCPLVRIGALQTPDDTRFPTVLLDLMSEGRMAADYFAERGFRSLANFGHIPWADLKGVSDGFHERANELGIECNLYRLRSERKTATETKLERFKRRVREIGSWISSLPKPLGVLCYSDMLAGRVCLIAETVGLTVPEEVAILGRGNDPFRCSSALVPLSSLEINHGEMGRQAAQLLQRQLEGETPPQEPIMIPSAGIVERRSTDVLAVPDPIVAKALRFIWDHLEDNISVDDIAVAAGTSRSGLDRGFRRCLQRGANAELRRKRLERCCELLRSTDLTGPQLLPLTGFRSLAYLHRSFRKAFGLTPREYRHRTRGENHAIDGQVDAGV